MTHNKLLIIGSVWPEPKSSAAGIRMLQLIEVFQSQKYIITFASACTKSKNAFDLSIINIPQVEVQINDSNFDNLIKELSPDIVLFDRFMTEEQFGWRIAEHCPNAIRILDTEDLHCLRRGREQALKANKPFDDAYLFNDTAKREIASIYRCDLSLIISEIELNILIEKFMVHDELLLYLPFMLNSISDEIITQLLKFENRQHFITIGNFLHAPNYDAILYLKKEIWPLIRTQLPNVELHIYGAYSSEKVEQLHNEKDGFLIKGFAADVNEVMQNARVCLVPLRFGAGLKGKLIDAMQNGTPSVMTTIAEEGMFGKFNPNGFIENSPKQFADKAVQLYSEKMLWNDFQHNGFEVINKRFDETIFKDKFINVINEFILSLSKKRNNNFIGQMLQHHQLQSTKYMSRWIEEKNKKA